MIYLFAGVFSLASCVMAMHYETIIDIYRACPIPLLYGDIETGTQVVHYSHMHEHMYEITCTSLYTAIVQENPQQCVVL